MKALDELDRRMLYLLSLDSRQSAAALAKKAKARKETVNFRLKRLVKEGVITHFTAWLDDAKFGYMSIKVYLQFQNYDEGVEKELYGFLQTFPRVCWVVSCSGRWDVIFAYWAHSSFEFYQDLNKIVNRFSRHIISKQICHNMSWYYYDRKWLWEGAGRPVAVKYSAEPGPYRLGKLDKDVLGALIEDARMPLVEMARRAGTGPQNVLNRMRKLREMGILNEMTIALDYKKMGILFCKSFVYLQNTTAPKLEKLHDYCSRQPNVHALSNTLGPWDMELEFEVENFEQMTDAMNGLRKNFGDLIRNYESVIITRQTEIRYLVE